MQKFKLSNGLTVLVEKRPTLSLAIEVSVKVGSNYENPKIAGISHFIEHILFEGTKKRTAREIANGIEGIGGEINANTSNEKTSFYIRVLKKHFDVGLEVLADLIQNPAFNDLAIEKERKIILDEIDLIRDDPMIYQWILFQNKLFKKHPCKNPIYGDKEAIKAVTKKDILDFYKKYYVPNNTIITIVGDIKDPITKVKNCFVFKKRKLKEKKRVAEPGQHFIEEFAEKREIEHSYLVLGYKVPERNNKESYVLDVIRAILGRGQSSRLFNEIRIKKGLGYLVGAHYESGTDYGFFGVYVSTDQKNVNEVKKIILDEIKKMENVEDKELVDAKKFIEGNFIIENEDVQNMASKIGYWEIIKDGGLISKYIKNIMEVSKKDIARVVKKYFKKHTCIILEQKV